MAVESAMTSKIGLILRHMKTLYCMTEFSCKQFFFNFPDIVWVKKQDFIQLEIATSPIMGCDVPFF